MVDVVNKVSMKDIIKREYARCAAEPEYFMKKYCVIRHPKRGKIPFILYPFQEDCLGEFQDNTYNIILKSRQLGLSTLVAGYIVWRMIFMKDQQILVIATGKDVAKNMITKVRVMFQGLPSWMKVKTDSDNKLSLELVNGSVVTAVSSAPDRARSEALSLLVIDEAAFINNIADIWTAAQQTLATGGDCIVLSTPNGMGNWFHTTWLDAEDEKNSFHTIKLKWTVHPERNQAWRDEQNKDLGLRKAAQECDADFLTSGNSVVDMQILQFYRETYIREPEEKRSVDKGLWVWEYPNSAKSYVIAADVARGDGSDYSACHVFDVENVVQVAEYRGMIGTREFGRFLAALGTEYYNALVVVERENVGWDVLQELIDLNYQNLFYSSNDLMYVDALYQIKNKVNSEEKKMKPGFATTVRNRPLIVSKIERYFEERGLIVYSKRLISELETFIWKDGKAQATAGRNDDTVIALGILLWVRDTALKLRNEGIELTKMTLSKIGRSEQFKGIYGGNSFNTENPWKLNLGKENLKLDEYL